MPVINIRVRSKQAKLVGTPVITCGNSDYSLHFDFDEEFAEYTAKTLRIVFRQRGQLKHWDLLFNGDAVSLPPVYEVDAIACGVYAGNLISTTACVIPCAYSTGAEHEDPPPDVYTQLLEYLANMGLEAGVIGKTVCKCHGVNADKIGIAETED